MCRHFTAALLHNPKALLGLLAILCVLLVLPGVLTIAHVGTFATLGIAVILWSKA